MRQPHPTPDDHVHRPRAASESILLGGLFERREPHRVYDRERWVAGPLRQAIDCALEFGPAQALRMLEARDRHDVLLGGVTLIDALHIAQSSNSRTEYAC
jgi:hypothetical protein